MKYLIVGLGNIGAEYAQTRHNIGFMVVDAFAQKHNGNFTTARYADTAECKIKGKNFFLIKPSTYMNLSGKAVRHWANELKISPENIMVIVDDIALPFAKIRLRPKGSDGGHNGLKSIQELLGTDTYPRLKFGVGSDFPKGKQADYVLSNFSSEEQKDLPAAIEKCCQAIETFAFVGLEKTMGTFNS